MRAICLIKKIFSICFKIVAVALLTELTATLHKITVGLSNYVCGVYSNPSSAKAFKIPKYRHIKCDNSLPKSGQVRSLYLYP